MRTEIYYFTGTGNTLAAARKLAAVTGGALIPIAPFKDEPFVYSGAEAVGVVYPVYYAGPPAIVCEFLEKLKFEGRPYLFAAATFGGSAGRSFTMIREIMRGKGMEMDACFGIHMPQNAFKKPWERQDKLTAQAEKRAQKVAEAVLRRKKGTHHANALLEMMMKPMNGPVRKASRKAVAEFAGESGELEFNDLIRLSDKNFEATEECSVCGLCEKVCPTCNIQMQGGRPVWLHRCENCLACAHWCPERAIRGGVIGAYYYRHPDLKTEDMRLQRDGRV